MPDPAASTKPELTPEEHKQNLMEFYQRELGKVKTTDDFVRVVNLVGEYFMDEYGDSEPRTIEEHLLCLKMMMMRIKYLR